MDARGERQERVDLRRAGWGSSGGQAGREEGKARFPVQRAGTQYQTQAAAMYLPSSPSATVQGAW